jgi:hypothetical protein
MPTVGCDMHPVPMRAWLDILRGAWMVLPAAPAPSEVVAMVREKGGQEEEEEELAWLEALAGCLGAAVAMARATKQLAGKKVRKGVVSTRVDSRLPVDQDNPSFGTAW